MSFADKNLTLVWPILLALIISLTHCTQKSDLRKNDLPVQLAKVQDQLTHLSLYDSPYHLDWLKGEKLTHLTIEGKKFAKGLNHQLHSVTHLSIENTSMTDLNFLNKLPQLNYLHLSANNSLNNLSKMKEINTLSELVIEGQPLEHLDFLPVSLKRLTLKEVNVPQDYDLSKLSTLKQLDTLVLELHGAGLNYPSLEKLVKLTNLTLKNSNIADIADLKLPKSLVTMHLERNYRLNNLAALQEHKSLKHLVLLDNTRIKAQNIPKTLELNSLETSGSIEYTLFKYQPSLKKLSLYGTLLSDMPQEPLQQLIALETLEIKDISKPTDLSFLQYFSLEKLILEELDLDPKALEHIKPKNGLSMVRCTLAPDATKLMHLQELHLENTPLPDFSKFTSLGQLSIKGNHNLPEIKGLPLLSTFSFAGIYEQNSPYNIAFKLKAKQRRQLTFQDAEALELKYNQFDLLPESVPQMQGIKILSLEHTPITALPKLSQYPKLGELNIKNTRIRDLPNLPETIVKLTISPVKPEPKK